MIVGASKFLRLFVQVGILGLGAYLVLRGELTGGGMVAASILLGRALAPVEQAIGAWRAVVGVRASHRPPRALLRRHPERPAAIRLPVPEGRVSVDRLVFKAPNSQRLILKGVELRAQARARCWRVVGPSASGKIDPLRLLIGVWPPPAGHVRLDGADVHGWERRRARPPCRLPAAGRRAVRRHGARQHRAHRRRRGSEK